MEFSNIANDVWLSLENIRNETADNRFVKWVLLKESGSMDGNICGIRVFQKGLLFKKEYAEIIISVKVNVLEKYDVRENAEIIVADNLIFTIDSWRHNHMPVEIFSTEDSKGYKDNINLVTNKFKEITILLAEPAKSENLDSKFPKAWIGESASKSLKNYL